MPGPLALSIHHDMLEPVISDSYPGWMTSWMPSWLDNKVNSVVHYVQKRVNRQRDEAREKRATFLPKPSFESSHPVALNDTSLLSEASSHVHVGRIPYLASLGTYNLGSLVKSVLVDSDQTVDYLYEISSPFDKTTQPSKSEFIFFFLFVKDSPMNPISLSFAFFLNKSLLLETNFPLFLPYFEVWMNF